MGVVLVEVDDDRQEGAQKPGVVAVHHLHPETKEAALPSGERPKSREETPKKGMRPKAHSAYARSMPVATPGQTHGCVPAHVNGPPTNPTHDVPIRRRLLWRVGWGRHAANRPPPRTLSSGSSLLIGLPLGQFRQALVTGLHLVRHLAKCLRVFVKPEILCR